ncbi:flagellar biosynthesis protein FlgL [Frigidibacter albus]|uniref:Flagellar biosynthesis protein FlgL n=1 Tax=Frigidibacter albus TaxID=1465486 RepID=A0A6L8VGZ7_9RHOB|nr:flagellin [Frigidibacter albus]MZQ89678.1 flagellar biosynthesis protein FlgL [Frigidibacter albus]NBE31584.1 flagellar biosynthesis protein FlgL [Frigidibacter albus]GGH54733.1 flagellar hook protein FlgL [Frigidibacter albus]
MNFTSIGDLAMGLQMRQQNQQLKEHLTRLSSEVISGVRQDVGAAVSGDFAALSGIERGLRTLEAYKLSTGEAALFTGTLQTALGQVAEMGAGLGVPLLAAATTANPVQVDTLAYTARQKLGAMVGALNLRVADRYALSGAATDTPPLAGAGTILSALQGAVAGASTVSDIADAVADWFDAPAGGGGFLDVAYQGAAAGLSPFLLGEGDSAELALTAADPRLRAALAGVALAALLDDGLLGGDTLARGQIAERAGTWILNAEPGLTALRAELGTTEARIDEAATRNSAEVAALKIARNTLIGADPYESAAELEAVQSQLETLYTLTARVAQLSLADYL